MIHATEEEFKTLSKKVSSRSVLMPSKTPNSGKIRPKAPKVAKTSSNESEGAISAGIEALMLSRGWYGIRINSGIVPVGNSRGWFKGAEAGTPDRLFFRPHKNGGVILLFIEVKREGKTPSDKQLFMMGKLRGFGAITRTARSKQDADTIHESLKEFFTER